MLIVLCKNMAIIAGSRVASCSQCRPPRSSSSPCRCCISTPSHGEALSSALLCKPPCLGCCTPSHIPTGTRSNTTPRTSFRFRNSTSRTTHLSTRLRTDPHIFPSALAGCLCRLIATFPVKLVLLIECSVVYVLPVFSLPSVLALLP